MDGSTGLDGAATHWWRCDCTASVAGLRAGASSVKGGRAGGQSTSQPAGGQGTGQRLPIRRPRLQRRGLASRCGGGRGAHWPWAQGRSRYGQWVLRTRPSKPANHPLLSVATITPLPPLPRPLSSLLPAPSPGTRLYCNARHRHWRRHRLCPLRLPCAHRHRAMRTRLQPVGVAFTLLPTSIERAAAPRTVGAEH